MTLDKGAASRFINAAISSSRSKVDPFYIAEEGNAAAGPSGTHTRFGTEGEEVEKLLEDDDDEEEESDDEDAEDAIVQAMVVEEETKGKKAEKKERPRMDPFAGASLALDRLAARMPYAPDQSYSFSIPSLRLRLTKSSKDQVKQQVDPQGSNAFFAGEAETSR